MSRHWPGAPTASASPRPAKTRASGSGGPTARRARSSGDSRRSSAWCGVPTANTWPRRGARATCGSGTSTARPALTFVGYPEIESVAVRPDGLRLASARRNSPDVLLWGPDGTPDTVLKGHTRDVACLAWSPDGKRLATGSDDASARLWEADGTPGARSSRASRRRPRRGLEPRRPADRLREPGQDRADLERRRHRGRRPEGNAQEVLCRGLEPRRQAGRLGGPRWDGAALGRRRHAQAAPGPLQPDPRTAWRGAPTAPGSPPATAGATCNCGEPPAPPGRPCGETAGRVTSIAWHHDSARLAVGSNASAVRLWDINGVRGPVLSFDPESDASFVAWAATEPGLWRPARPARCAPGTARPSSPSGSRSRPSLLDVTAFTASGRPLRSNPTALREFVYLIERPGHGVATMTHDEFVKAAGRETSKNP